MNDISFNSVNELYNRLLPALKSKIIEFKRKDILYIKENDIWNYLRMTKWSKTNNLELCDMVSDIIDITSDEMDIYLKDKLRSTKSSVIDGINELL